MLLAHSLGLGSCIIGREVKAKITGSLGGVPITSTVPDPVYICPAPGMASGVYQINFQIPKLPSGDHELILEADGVRTPSGVFLTIE
jgi:uncharacterized protein (TIGR03437 family)